MPLSYGRGLPPEKVAHTYIDQHGNERTYQAVGTGNGRNWDVVDPSGKVHKNGITNSSRWAASIHLNDLAMADHDARRLAKPSPRMDRIVAVNESGDVTGATIIPQQRRGS